MAFNKTLYIILRKIEEKNKKNWPEKLLKALWPEKLHVRTVSQGTLYCLVFEGDAIFSLEIQLQSLKVAIQEEITNEEKANMCLAELESHDEDRLIAKQNLEIYRHQMLKAFNKRVRL